MLAISSNKSASTLSWEFFLQRFNSISMETQLVGDILSPVDISGVNVNNNNTQRKINIAKLALKRSDYIKSINSDMQHVYNPTSIMSAKTTESSSIKSGEKERSEYKFVCFFYFYYFFNLWIYFLLKRIAEIFKKSKERGWQKRVQSRRLRKHQRHNTDW